MRLWLAANQGLVGGGEVMLLRCAAAARELGLDVSVVAPADPADTLSAATEADLDVVPLQGRGRAAYARTLRRWDASRRGVLWCHGLLPALATAGHRDRIVHLHQLPTGPDQRLSLRLAAPRALAVVVPSLFLAARLPGSRVLANWTDDLEVRRAAPHEPSVVGFLGRLSQDKGVDVLARAVRELDRTHGRPVRLLVAGDSRFVPDEQRHRVAAALRAAGPGVDHRGWMPREEFFSSVDLAVVPSVAPESFGLAVAEAMAARVPVVVTDAGALPEVAGPAYPWVARAGDGDDLAVVLAAALDGDATPVVDRARRRWEAQYSPAAGRAAVARLLRDVGLVGAVA